MTDGRNVEPMDTADSPFAGENPLDGPHGPWLNQNPVSLLHCFSPLQLPLRRPVALPIMNPCPAGTNAKPSTVQFSASKNTNRRMQVQQGAGPSEETDNPRRTRARGEKKARQRIEPRLTVKFDPGAWTPVDGSPGIAQPAP